MTLEPIEPNKNDDQKIKFNLAVGALVASFFGLFAIFAPWVTTGVYSVSGNRSNEGIFPFAVTLFLLLFGLSNLFEKLNQFEKITRVLLLISSVWSLASYYEWHQNITDAVSGSSSTLNKSLNDITSSLGNDFQQTLQNIAKSFKPSFGVGFWLAVLVSIVGAGISILSFREAGATFENILIKKTAESKTADEEQGEEITDSKPNIKRIVTSVGIGILVLVAVLAVINFGVNKNNGATANKAVATASPSPSPLFKYSKDFSYRFDKRPRDCDKSKNYCISISVKSSIACEKGYRFVVFFFPPDKDKAFALADFSVSGFYAAGIVNEIRGQLPHEKIQSDLDSKTLALDWATDYEFTVDKIRCA